MDVQRLSIQVLYFMMLGLVCQGGEHEYRLTKYLLSNYEEIVDVDEKNQILTTNCWLTQIWNDTHLRWNYSDFGGIQAIRLPHTKVWKPDLILYNNADSQYNTATINTNVIVTHTGKVVWLSHGMFKSSCEISVEYFPFDIQDCHMKWASWTYDGYSLDLRDQNINSSGDMSNYQINGEFLLEDFRSEYHMKYYSCCEEPYPDITYTIRIRRRPLFYVFNLILPCVLINGIALLVFYVPSESGEKVTLGISALLSMTVFLMTIRESLPPTEKTPLITLYYGVSICLVSFASAMAVVTLNIHYRGLRGAEVPYRLKAIFLGFFARIVFIQPTSDFQNKKVQIKFEKQQKERNGVIQGSTSIDNAGIFSRSYSPLFEPAGVGCGVVNGRHHVNTDIQRDNQQGGIHNNIQLHSTIQHTVSQTCDLLNDPKVDGMEFKFQSVLHKVSNTIDKNEERFQQTDKKEQHALEWKQVALVIDRLLLLLFFLAMTISSFVILTSSPHLGPGNVQHPHN